MMGRAANRSVARNGKAQNPSSALPLDQQVASTNATASAFISTRPRPEWLSPSATNPASVPVPAKKAARPRKPDAVKPALNPTAVAQSIPLPQSHPQLQHQQALQQPAQAAVLPSPAPSNEPSPSLANAALDSPTPAFIPDAQEMVSTTTPASVTTPMLRPRTEAQFAHDLTTDTGVHRNGNGNGSGNSQVTWAAGEAEGNRGVVGTSATPIDLENGDFSTINGTPNQTPLLQLPPIQTAPASPAATEFKYSDLNRVINEHVDRYGGITRLTPNLERPRLQLLSEACEKSDVFFIVLHQVYAIWSASRSEAHRRLPRLPPERVDAAFTVIEEILKRNQLVALPHRQFFETFPCRFDDAVRLYPAYGVALTWVQEFLDKIVGHHRALAEATWSRGYPYLVDELITRLGCFSPVLQMIFFTSNRRRLGVSDGPLSTQIEAIFKSDQSIYNKRPWGYSADSAAASRAPELGQRNTVTVQQYRQIVDMARIQQQNQTIMLAQAQAQSRRHNLQSPVNFGGPTLPNLTTQQGVASRSPVLPSRLLNQTPLQHQVPFSPSAPNQTIHQAQASPTVAGVTQPTQTLQHPSNHHPQLISAPQQILLDFQLQRQQQQQQQQQQHHHHHHQYQHQHQHQHQHQQQQHQQQQQLYLQQQEQQRQLQHQQQQHQQQQSNQQSNQQPNLVNVQRSVGLQQQQRRWSLEQAARRSTAQPGQLAVSHAQQTPMASPLGVAPPTPTGIRTNAAWAYAPQGNRQLTPQQHRSSQSLGLIIPDKHVVIPRPEWPYDPTDRKAIHMSLHQAHLRSPRRVLKNGDVDPVFQSMKYFAIEPTAVAPSTMIQSFRFVVTDSQFALAAPSTRRADAASVSQVEHFDGALRWRLRCCKSNSPTQPPTESEWVTLDMNWPSNIFLRLNQKTLEVRRQPHNGKDLAVELTDHIVCGINLLEISVPIRHGDGIDNFRHVAVEVLETLGYSHVLKLVWESGIIPEEQTLQTIQKRLAPPADDDGLVIEAPDLSVDLACPFSAVIFEVPARGASCTHLECFDLETWLKTRPAKPVIKCLHGQIECDCPKTAEPSNPDKWRCPICLGDARPYSLRIDEFMLKVRRELEQQGKLHTKCMHVKADGTWTVVLEDEVASDSDDDVPFSRSSNGPPTLKRKASTTPIVSRRPEMRRPDVEVIEID